MNHALLQPNPLDEWVLCVHQGDAKAKPALAQSKRRHKSGITSAEDENVIGVTCEIGRGFPHSSLQTVKAAPVRGCAARTITRLRCDNVEKSLYR